PHVAAVGTQPAEDVPLHPEVVRGDLQAARRTALGRDAELAGIFVGPVERTRGGDTTDEIRPFHLRDGPGALDERRPIEVVAGDDHSAHDAARSPAAREPTRVAV